MSIQLEQKTAKQKSYNLPLKADKSEMLFDIKVTNVHGDKS